jgi:hypothetical protein
MDASKLINGSRAGVLVKRSGPAPKSGQPSTVSSEAKKVGKTATKKAKTERPQLKAIRKSKSEKLVCRYLRKLRPSPQLYQATRSRETRRGVTPPHSPRIRESSHFRRLPFHIFASIRYLFSQRSNSASIGISSRDRGKPRKPKSASLS